jgi:hypothetical protein
MVEGFILDQSYGATLVSRWIEGPPDYGFFGNAKFRGKGMRKIEACRCPGCGYLECYANDLVT